MNMSRHDDLVNRLAKKKCKRRASNGGDGVERLFAAGSAAGSRRDVRFTKTVEKQGEKTLFAIVAADGRKGRIRETIGFS